MCSNDSLLKPLYRNEVELIKNAQEGVKNMDFEVTNMALRSYWMTMGKFFEFSKPQFSQLLWMRIPISPELL